ncbi:SpvB/TcaC N-terminal domain-containing protein [Kitasatospora griseola]|uniref:SpvB/TcaC N-terminal domain-containing protein n=1 Tax=Kitasatospora griseola TaxID=2064 RepID=UPI003855703F
MSVKAPVIDLPSGGGAIAGLGEAFRADPQTGTGTFTLPVELPAGRAGLTPKLALEYSSGNPNGPFGMGWRLSPPDVRRSTRRGLPHYDERDTFLLSGAEDLVPVPGCAPGRTRYRPRTESGFARIEHVTADGQDYWEVRTGDGLTNRYGTVRPPQAAPDWRDPAALTDPADPARIFGWLLSESADPHGNRVLHRYRRDAGPGHEQLHLADIRYVERGDGEFLVHVVLDHQERADRTSDRRPGFELRTALRCTRIETWMHHGEQPVLARRVEFGYTEAANSASLLTRVTVSGHDGEAVQSTPPIELGYSGYDPAARRHRPLGAPAGALPATSLADPTLELVDLFGEGLPSLVQLTGQYARYWRNLGDGRFARPVPLTAPDGLALADPGVQLADCDGDGRTDLLVPGGHYPPAPNGGFDPARFVRHAAAPPFDLDDPAVKLVDLDGDGITDAVRSGGAGLELFLQQPGRGWTTARRAPAAPPVPFTDPRVHLADMTGDGLSDIVLVEHRRVRYWPYLGHGRWGAEIRMTAGPVFDEGTDFDPRRVLLGDLDGDGCADLVYVGDGHLTLWLNRSGTGFAPPLTLHGTPGVTDLDAVRLVDLLGHGTQGILWSRDAGRGTGYAFLDLTGGTKPYLLTSVDNHRGMRGEIRYAPSTRFRLADAAERRPWATVLPFPVQVVAGTTVRDQLARSAQSTVYRYHHGAWDGAEREFRGFGRVDVFDARTDRAGEQSTPPTETRTWYHLGPLGPAEGDWNAPDLRPEHWSEDPARLGPTEYRLPEDAPRRALRDAARALRGRVQRSELYAADGHPVLGPRPYTVTEYRHRVAAVLDGAAGAAGRWAARPVVHAAETAHRSTDWLRGDEPMHRFGWSDDFDEYGRPRLTGEAGVPRGQDPAAPTGGGEPYLVGAVRTEYAAGDDGQAPRLDLTAATTRLQVTDPGTLPLAELWRTVGAGTAATVLLGHERTHYDGEPFEGLPLGRAGARGLPARTETLVHTARTLTAAWDEEAPPCLAGTESPADYPAQWRDALPPYAGYRYVAGEPGRPDGWYAVTSRLRHTDRGQVAVQLDALDGRTEVAYDRYELLPVRTTDPVGLTSTAEYDYRVLRPALGTDPNGNRTLLTYSPLGLPTSIALLGRSGEEDGDTPEQPGTVFEYRLDAWDVEGGPAWVHTSRRTEHRWAVVLAERARRLAAGRPAPTTAEIAALFPTDERERHPERFVQQREATDGFGRLLQTRVQADELTVATLGLPADPAATVGEAVGLLGQAGAPRVAVTGWRTYDDKGRVTVAYEPYYAEGWNWTPPEEQQPDLARVTTHRDPRGEVVRVTAADGSELRTVHGRPAALGTPDEFRPTPWETWTYDASDNAGRTHPGTSGTPAGHHDTPTTALRDALGRTVATVERLADRALTTRTRLDFEGRVVETVDALGRTGSRTAYDLLGRPWRTEHRDSGVRRRVLDPLDGPLEEHDARGAVLLTRFDAAHRPVRLWARDDADSPITLRVETVYGDTLTAPDAGANLLGRAHVVRDEAGELTHEAYDRAGRPLETVRRLPGEELPLPLPGDSGGPTDPGGSDGPGGPPGSGDPMSLTGTGAATVAATGTGGGVEGPAPLDLATYRLSNRYDALGRRTLLRCPEDVTGHRAEITAGYGRSGALAELALDGVPHLRRAAYDARGRRVLTLYGNGVLTRALYDPHSGRPARLRSEPATEFTGADGAPHWQSRGPAVEDRAYRHDLVGNVLTVTDTHSGSGLAPTPDRLIRLFDHDPLYRLVAATGREHEIRPATPWSAGPAGTDPTRTRAYRESYEYDDAGNLTTLTHAADGAGRVRRMPTEPGHDRPAALLVADVRYEHRWDACGNLLSDADSRHFGWDAAGRLTGYREQAGRLPTLQVVNRYDAAGQRVLKTRQDMGGARRLTVDIDGVFERIVLVAPTGAVSAHDTVHLPDGESRVGSVRFGPALPGDLTPAVKYALHDHLGSVGAVLDQAGALVNREEYTPYGETSFGSYAAKRHRFTGMEREEESGLARHGARHYAPWLGRWTSPDPAGEADGSNRYAYTRGNPLRRVDRTGTSGKEADEEKSKAGAEKPPKLSLSQQIRRRIGKAGQETATFLPPAPGTGPSDSEIAKDLLKSAAVNAVQQHPVVQAAKLGLELAEKSGVDVPGVAQHVVDGVTEGPHAAGVQVGLGLNLCPGVCLFVMDVNVGVYFTPPTLNNQLFDSMHFFAGGGSAEAGLTGSDTSIPGPTLAGIPLAVGASAGGGPYANVFWTQAATPGDFRGEARNVAAGYGDWGGGVSVNSSKQMTYSAGTAKGGFGGGVFTFDSYTWMSDNVWPFPSYADMEFSTRRFLGIPY